MDRASALSLLRFGIGDEQAEFRDDQWEIIDALVNRREKVLLVQRTGWGKSAVYFISASMLRHQGFGVTLIVSPLVGLMRNQVRAGQRMGLRIGALHAGTNDRFDTFRELVRTDRIDVLLVAPNGSPIRTFSLSCFRSSSNARACWSSTRLTASPTGGTTSGRITVDCRTSSASCHQTARCWRPPPPPMTG